MSSREILERVFRLTLGDLDPARLVSDRLRGERLVEPVSVVAIGKAAPSMTRGALAALGDSVAATLVVSDRPTRLEGAVVLTGSHPIPDERSVSAGTAALAAARAARGTLLVLVSGGASALAEIPAAGLLLGDLAATQRALTEAGAPIGAMNTVRRHLSDLKDGRLLDAAADATVMTLLLSDVIDEPASAIGSGPTLADGTTPGDALAVIDSLDVRDRIPSEVLSHLESSTRHPVPGRRHRWDVLAGPVELAERAKERLSAEGLDVAIATTSLRGEARVTGARFARAIGRATVATGETTVTIRGGGTGGRNQEAALAGAIAIEGRALVFAALATDGVDGPTTAAGAIVDGDTCRRIRAAGLDPEALLGDNDSHRALLASGDLVVTGPTGTNLGDLWIGLSELDRPRP